MLGSLQRLLAALPDAITAAAFAVAWIAPATLGPEYVNRLTLIMLFEFIVVHSSGFYAGIVAATEVDRGRRVKLLMGLSALYLLFILAFTLAYQSIWPLLAFAWLFVSRFMQVWARRVTSTIEIGCMFKLWAVSVAAYVLGAMITVVLPLPALGMTREFIASMQLTGGGEWNTRPQTVLAFGLLYFSIQAWAKYALSGATAPAGAPPGVFAQRVAGIESVARRSMENP
jgi:hypothetical protein